MSFYKSKVYKGNRPVVNLSPTIFNIHKPEDNMLLDADLKRIVESSIANEAYNNEVCFWVDGMVRLLLIYKYIISLEKDYKLLLMAIRKRKKPLIHGINVLIITVKRLRIIL